MVSFTVGIHSFHSSAWKGKKARRQHCLLCATLTKMHRGNCAAEAVFFFTNVDTVANLLAGHCFNLASMKMLSSVVLDSEAQADVSK